MGRCARQAYWRRQGQPRWDRPKVDVDLKPKDESRLQLFPNYTAEERDRAQGALNFCVFATLALTSFASGVLVTTQGWQLLNYGSLVPMALTGAALLWLAQTRRREAAAAGT